MLGEKLGKFQGKVTGQRILPAAAAMLCLALVLSPIANVQAAELQILAGGAMAGPLRELAAPPPDGPPAPETVSPLLRRLTGVDITRCPVCREGRLHVVGLLRPGALPVPGWDTS